MNFALNRYFSSTFLAKNCNQADGLARFAIHFIEHGNPAPLVIERTKMFHTDSFLCALSAIALKTNAPHVLRN
jgi:2-methylcitrate dehydratase